MMNFNNNITLGKCLSDIEINRGPAMCVLCPVNNGQ